MGVLAVYDTAGIQNYIFASNKLAENVGGSRLVADIFRADGLLPEAIHKITQQPVPDWRSGGALNRSLKAEIIYQGGGNAYVAFADDSTFQDVTKAFLIEVNKTAPGVGIAVAAVGTDFGDTYQGDFKRLNKRLALVKGGFNIPTFAGNQPITKQSIRTGLPVSVYRGKEKEFLTESQSKKRIRYERDNKKPNKQVQGVTDPQKIKETIEDFDDLAFDKGSDSLIAIVHADGNNMGSRIKEFMEKDEFQTYDVAVPEIRKLSVQIDNCYMAARGKTIEAFKSAYAMYVDNFRNKYPGKYLNSEDKNYDLPPILELIKDGDDTTLVIGGRFAIDFAVRLLREIEKTKPDDRPFKDAAPTACAGVVLFHSHYPFSEAYKLAEELCSSAKTPSRKYEGSYIDFHLHQSGNVSGLHHLRERQYKVDGLTIVRRPWRVSKGLEDKLPNFKWFEETAQQIKPGFEDAGNDMTNTDDKIPRNKIKAIRNAISAGEDAAKNAEYQMRGRKLPKLTLKPLDKDMSGYAPQFDVLELLDAYENLLNKNEVNKGGDTSDKQNY